VTPRKGQGVYFRPNQKRWLTSLISGKIRLSLRAVRLNSILIRESTSQLQTLREYQRMVA